MLVLLGLCKPDQTPDTRGSYISQTWQKGDNPGLVMYKWNGVRLHRMSSQTLPYTHSQSVSVLNLPCWTAQWVWFMVYQWIENVNPRVFKWSFADCLLFFLFCLLISSSLVFFFPLPILSHHFPSFLLASLFRIYRNLSSNLPTTPLLKLIYGWMIHQTVSAAEWKGFAHIFILHSTSHKCMHTHIGTVAHERTEWSTRGDQRESGILSSKHTDMQAHTFCTESYSFINGVTCYISPFHTSLDFL